MRPKYIYYRFAKRRAISQIVVQSLDISQSLFQLNKHDSGVRVSVAEELLVFEVGYFQVLRGTLVVRLFHTFAAQRNIRHARFQRWRAYRDRAVVRLTRLV